MLKNRDIRILLILFLILLFLTTVVYIYSYTSKKNHIEINSSFYQELVNQTVILDDTRLYNKIDSVTGIIYFGFESCPWCNIILPVLIDAAKEFPDISIYSYDPSVIREEESELYMKILEKYDEYLDLDEDGKKRLFVPDVYAIVNGEVVSCHKDAVESYTYPNRELTEEEYEELKTIYIEMFKDIQDYNKE